MKGATTVVKSSQVEGSGSTNQRAGRAAHCSVTLVPRRDVQLRNVPALPALAYRPPGNGRETLGQNKQRRTRQPVHLVATHGSHTACQSRSRAFARARVVQTHSLVRSCASCAVRSVHHRSQLPLPLVAYRSSRTRAGRTWRALSASSPLSPQPRCRRPLTRRSLASLRRE